MPADHFKPTLRARLHTTATLLDQEAEEIEDYVPERDREAMLALLQAGWREIARIRARALVNEMLARSRPGN